MRSCSARQPNRLAGADGLNDRIGPIFRCSRHFNLRPQSRELTEGGLACLQVRLQRLVIVTQLVELQERGVIHEANRLFQHHCLSEIDGNAVASAFRRTSQQSRLDAYSAKIRGQEITDYAYAMWKLRLIRRTYVTEHTRKPGSHEVISRPISPRSFPSVELHFHVDHSRTMLRQGLGGKSLPCGEMRTEVRHKYVCLFRKFIDRLLVTVDTRIQVGFAETSLTLPIQGRLLNPIQRIQVEAICALGRQLTHDGWTRDDMRHAEDPQAGQRSRSGRQRDRCTVANLLDRDQRLGGIVLVLF